MEIRQRLAQLMPDMIDELSDLVAHPSVAFDGFPREPVGAMGRATHAFVARSGFGGARLLDIGHGQRVVYADVAGPVNSPTILLYAHYDVQPAPTGSGWRTDPWRLTEFEGRLYGRGAADDKSGIVIHAATMRLFDGQPPVRIKLVIEGDEEAQSQLEDFAMANTDLFRADVYVSADNGNLVAGQPVLTISLRGDVTCRVETRTLSQPVHSGLFGGVAPDALVALIHVLAGLWDGDAATAVPGLRSYDWPDIDVPADLIRTAAAVDPDIELAGTGSIPTRLWSRPSATILGLDAPSVAGAANILIPSARAKVGLRIAPDADADLELERLAAFLRSRAPSWAAVEVTPNEATAGFEAPRGGPAMRAAQSALRHVYGVDPSEIGGGGGIPLLRALQRISPTAEFVLWGAQDLRANAHGANESVDPSEIERIIASQVLLLEELGAQTGSEAH